MIKLNNTAPDFDLPDQDNKLHKLSGYIGKWVLIYFYPKDDTPGCTKEACALRDNFPKFKNTKAIVLGISKDSVASHKKFASKYELPFTLLADENKKVQELYGAWAEKSFMGKRYMGTKRISFLVNPIGKVAKIYDKVKPAIHAEEVLADIKELSK